MPRIQRSAGVAWEGNLARGHGTISGESGELDGRPIDQAARITTHAEGRTSPEELLATAHAGCFAMSLAGELTRAGTPPGKLDVRVTITLDEVEGKGHQIVGSDVAVRARVDGVERAAFDRVVAEAHAGCPFSVLIEASGTVTVNAELEEG